MVKSTASRAATACCRFSRQSDFACIQTGDSTPSAKPPALITGDRI